MTRSLLSRAVDDLAAAPGSATLALGDASRLRDLERETASKLAPVVVISFGRPASTIAADLAMPRGALGVLHPPLEGAHERPFAELDDILMRLPSLPGAVLVETTASLASLYGPPAAERFVRALCGYAREARRTVLLLSPRGHGPFDAVRPGVEALVDRVIEV